MSGQAGQPLLCGAGHGKAGRHGVNQAQVCSGRTGGERSGPQDRWFKFGNGSGVVAIRLTQARSAR